MAEVEGVAEVGVAEVGVAQAEGVAQGGRDYWRHFR